MLSPILLRLGALQHGVQNAGGIDPRLATALFDELAILEQAVVKNEVHTAPGKTFRRPEVQRFAEAVLIPLMQKELSRNAGLVGLWTLSNLPDLVASKEKLANGYTSDPRFLLAHGQRAALITGLFTSFLTIELVALGWIPSHSERKGLSLTRGDKSIHPGNTVHALSTGELSRESFLRLIE